MATYYVWSGAGGTNAGTSWTNAYTAFGSAVTAATNAGDVILVHYTHQEELASDTTYTFTANVEIRSVDKDSSDFPTVMGTGGWIGNSTTNRGITISAADRELYWYGITLRTAGSTSDSIILANSDGMEAHYDDCYFWSGNTSTSARIVLCNNDGAKCRCFRCTFRFGNTSQAITVQARGILEDCTISSDGSTPSTLFSMIGTSEPADLTCFGCDLSVVTGTLIPNSAGPFTARFIQCLLGSGVTMMAAQTTNPTSASAEVFVFDCSSGDLHYILEHHNALGSTVTDTGIYANDGAQYNTSGDRYSWKIVTTAEASRLTPYISPWIPAYNESTSAQSVSLEAIRSGSGSKYKESEFWSEWMWKGTSGSTKATFNITDRGGPAGSATLQDDGALSASGWTGENVTSVFMKLAPTGTITAAEIGDISARVCLAVPSTTVYVDPQIRGLS